MNIRIEQGAPNTPSDRRARRRLPGGLADVRRRTAQARLRTSDEPTAVRPPLTLVRRSGSCLAMAVAALAAPTLASPAFGATSQATVSQREAPAAPAPVLRHHLPHHLAFPGPGAISFQTWAAGSESRTADADSRSWATASAWLFGAATPLVDTALQNNTAPLIQQGPEVDPRCLTLPHHRPCVPWRFHNGEPMRAAVPGHGTIPLHSADPLADATRPVIEAARIAHANPREIGDPDTPAPDPKPAGDDTSTGPSSDFPRPGPATDQPADEPNAPAARTRVVPVALMTSPAITGTERAHSSAQAPAVPASALNPKRLAETVAKPLASPCLRAAYLVGKDRRMLAHLRPAADAMSVVLSHPHASCAAMVDYLSQSRA